MAAPTLTNEQRAKVIEMLAARETYSDIAETVGCSIANIDYYAKRNKATIAKAREEYDARYVDQGLRTREKRIERLERLAALHEKVLFREPAQEPPVIGEKSDKGGLYYTETKISATGLKVEYQMYNAPLVNQYRGIIKDLSEETNGRILRVAPTTPDGKEPYDGGSALKQLESAITGLAARVAAPQSDGEPDGGTSPGLAI